MIKSLYALTLCLLLMPLLFSRAAAGERVVLAQRNRRGDQIPPVVQGYVNTEAFDRADFLDKHPVKDDLTNLRMLLAGRVDLMVADKYVGYYLIRRHMPEDSGLITFHPKILEPKHLFLCISKKKKNARRLTDAFNRGLSRMKADGTLTSLLADMITPPR